MSGAALKVSFTRNLAANSAQQALAFALNLVALPAYLSILGPETYALVGFGLTVQILTQLLDAGMTPVLSREMTRMRAGDLEQTDVLAFIRTLDWLVFAIVVLISAVGFVTREWWGEHWFTQGSVPTDIVGAAMALIIVFSLLRWAGGLYRSALMGLERQVLASAIAATANTARLLLPIPLLIATGDVRLLFALWVVVSAIELAVFRTVVSASFSIRMPLFRFPANALRSRLRLGGSIAFLSIVGVVVTQSDKVILSKVLPMEAYGHFTLVAVLSSGMTMVVYPIMQAVQPRLTAQVSLGAEAELRHTFAIATQLTVLALLVPAVVLAVFPLEAIYAWTGDRAAASDIAPYAGIYLLGTGLMGLTALIYTLQLAHGAIRLHVIANIVLAVLIIPGMIASALEYGAWGAAVLWLITNLAMAIVYYPFVLNRFLPGDTFRWYARGLFAPLVVAAAIALLAHSIWAEPAHSRLSALILLAGTAIASLIGAVATTESGMSVIWKTARAISYRGHDGTKQRS